MTPIYLGSKAMRKNAKKRTATPVGKNSWKVTGGENEHIVTLADNTFTCDCDVCKEKWICSHVICVMMLRGMPLCLPT